MAQLIPLFPLSHVLLPGMPLPLHIFEQRYRDLITDITDTAEVARPPQRASFGVVALRAGTEAASPHLRGGAPDVETVGTLAEIIELERRPDGTADLLAVGSRRFRVDTLLPEGRSYLRAEVDFLDEADGALTPQLATRIRELIEVYDEVLVRLAGRGTGSGLPRDARELAYQVAARLPLTPADRQQVLADDSTAARLGRLGGLLRRELALLRGTRSIAVSPAVLRISTGIN